MMPRQGYGKKTLFFFILILAALVVMKNTGLKIDPVLPLEGSLRDVFAPAQKVSMTAARWLGNFFSFPVALINSTWQNKELNQKIDELQGRLQDFEECRLENERLKKLLVFQTTAHDLKFTAAEVISRDPGNWFKTINVDKGSRQGIQVNMTALLPEGLVGRVVKVSNETAEIMLITDPRSAVSSFIQESRSPGILEGTADTLTRLRMVYIPYDAVVSKEQVIITSGLGSLFPKGIPIGKILEAKKDPTGLYYNATVQPFVDFNRIEEVLIIITDFNVRLPASPGSEGF